MAKESQCEIFDSAEEFKGPVSSRKQDLTAPPKYYGPEMVTLINKYQEKVVGLITDDQIRELCQMLWRLCKRTERDYNHAMLIVHKNNPQRTITTILMPQKNLVSLLVTKNEYNPPLLWHRITFPYDN